MIAGFDFLWLSACVGIGAACVVSYLLGRFHGMAAEFEALRRPYQAARDWPPALQGDLPNVPLVHGSES